LSAGHRRLANTDSKPSVYDLGHANPEPNGFTTRDAKSGEPKHGSSHSDRGSSAASDDDTSGWSHQFAGAGRNANAKRNRFASGYSFTGGNGLAVG
jgi:hypothetical protein